MSLPAKILVVDDEAAIRSFLEDVLTNEGYQIVTADSAKAALTYIAEQKFGLILLDLNLQDMSGMAVMEQVTQCSPETAIVVLTAYASLETSVEALRKGAHDYLFKPVKVDELRESVRTGLDKFQRTMRQRSLLTELARSLDPDMNEAVPGHDNTSPATESKARFLEHGGLVIDLLRHVVTLDNHLLELSPTEFGLLAYMVSQAPRVLSHQELVREVQAYDVQVWEAADIVRHHIYRIRQKIKAATGRSDIIQTVRGMGYTVSDAPHA